MTREKLHGAWLVFALALLCGAVVGSTSCTVNPVAAAETTAQRGYALYGTFVIFEEQALVVARNPSLPNNIRQGLIAADEKAKPVADSLNAALEEYEQIRAEVLAGTTPAERLAIVSANLNQWVTDAAPLINALVEAVRGAR